jgi:3-phenylpropionate/trans-cinnamate dioxygenase ferredoxin reductase subunit
MGETILVVGGGQAAAQAVDTLRREAFSGRIVLVSNEPVLPYQRPPLSKKYLAGEMEADRLLFRHKAFYDEHKIELKLGISATRLNAAEHAVSLSSGEVVSYDRLLICTGAVSRRLTCTGADLPGVCYLRHLADVPAIQGLMKSQARVVIVGGGYIGLEAAATARQLGCSVTVLEMADRVMNRVVASNVSEYFAHEHRRHGVQLVCNARVTTLRGLNRIEQVVCADGVTCEADLVVVGIGATADVGLAQEAGLHCDNGLVVDEYCRTSDPSIYGAGDCTNHPSLRFEMRVRLESVDNAAEQATAAALNMIGKSTAHNHVPWFWSDQFDNKLLIAGLSQNHDQQVTRGDPSSRSFSICYLKGGELLAVEAINNAKDYMAARKLIAARFRPDIDKLADPRIALKLSA